MKKFVLLMVLILLLVLSACQNEGNNAAGSNLPTNSPTSSSNNGTTPKAETDSFLNLDELGQYAITTQTSKDYTEADLGKLSKDDTQKDYVAVVKAFVKQELDQEARYLDSVDGTYNPRKVLVGTTKGDTYILELRKWYNYNGIWTVAGYAQYKEPVVIPKKEVDNYELIDPSGVKDAAVQKQVNEKITARTEGHYYFNTEESLYVLLVAGKGQSVELLHVLGNEDNATLLDVEYAYTESKDLKFGENPYVLLKTTPTILDLFFKKYSSVQIDDARLNMP